MSSSYMTEQQQIEQFKAWWKKNGASTIFIFITVLLVSIGWRFWLGHDESKLERASSHYEELLNAVVNEDQTATTKEANLLRNNYEHTPYAALAALMLARNDVYSGDYDSAKVQLDWVMNHASTDSLKQVARLRLARIDLQQGQAQQSLQLLQKIDDVSYNVMIDELKGDSYLALKQIDEARQSYQQALAEFSNDVTLRPILQMKLDDLAVNANVQKTQGVNQ